MDGGPEHLAEELIVVMLFVLLAGSSFLWLRARQELGHLKQLFDELPNPLLRVDLISFKPLICNRAFSRLLGYADNLECVSQFDQHPHLPQQNFYQMYRLGLEAGMNEDGGVRTNIVLRDRQGNMVNQHLVVLLDKRNQYMDLVLDHAGSDRPAGRSTGQRSAKASGEDVLLQQNLLAYLRLDQELNIVSFNQASKALFQIQQNDTKALAFEDLFPSENSDRLINIYRRRLTRHGKLVLNHKTKIGTGDRKGQWNISKDPVEEHYHAFFCLDATNSFLDAPVSNLLDDGHGVWELDHRRGLIAHSEKWLEYLGYSASENIDKLSFWFSIVSPGDREMVTKTIQASPVKEPFKVQYKLASATGVELDIETRGFVVERDADGNPVLTRGIHIDVTGTKIQGLDRESHHQLMNQLASILGYADMIQSNDHVPTDVKGFAREVLANGEKIRDLLAPTDKHQNDSGTPIEKIASRHNLVVVGNSFLKSSIAESELEEIVRLVLAFMSNINGSDSNRNLTISQFADAQCSVCNQEINTNYVCLTLTQENLQVERNHFLHLLEPGFMTSSIGQENSLLQASELIHKHHGHIRLSLEESGLVIALCLPKGRLPEQETGRPGPQRTAEHAVYTGKNILIIDDEVSVANYLKNIVQQAGYEATVFTDPSAALEHFMHRPYQFDLVITDQTMPGVSGDVVMQAMLEQNPQLPIIMYTGYSETVNSSAARELGAAGCLTKPVRASHLMQTIEQFIGSAQ